MVSERSVYKEKRDGQFALQAYTLEPRVPLQVHRESQHQLLHGKFHLISKTKTYNRFSMMRIHNNGLYEISRYWV